MPLVYQKMSVFLKDGSVIHSSFNVPLKSVEENVTTVIEALKDRHNVIILADDGSDDTILVPSSNVSYLRLRADAIEGEEYPEEGDSDGVGS